MAFSPFDQRIINQLERPTSSDLNIAQGQINANVRAFARQLLQSTQSAYASGVGPGGALGNSFIIRAAAIPSLNTVTMTRGVGFAGYAPIVNDIGGINGLSTHLDYPVIYSQDRLLDLSGVAAPAAGTCRRDVIALRAIGQDLDGLGLTDTANTDIYDPGLEAFQSADRFKTLTSEMTYQDLTVLNAGDAITDALVYIKGAEVTYTGQDSLLDAPITTATTAAGPYINIAIINRYTGQTAITESDIVDYRLVASPGGQLTITGSATVGSNGLDGPGTNLTGVTIKAPPGIKAAIYKLGANAVTKTNTYALIVAGSREVSSASMTCTLGMPGGAYTALTTLLPSQVITGTQSRNLSADVATVALLADSAKSSPVQTIAVGQPYHVFPFTVGTVENVMELVSASVSGGSSGAVTIPTNPDFPAVYPAGTYDVAGNTATLTYYMNWAISPTAPTTALQSPTYALSTVSTSTASSPTAVVSDTAGGTRIAGFVVSPFDDSVQSTIPIGLWKLSVNAESTNGECSLKAKVYLYTGGSDPEAGTLIAESQWVKLTEFASDWKPYQDIYIRFSNSVATGPNRIYVVLYGLASTGTGTMSFNFGNEYPAVLQTNILATAPTVTIPDTTSTYPAGTYSVSGATSGTVTISVPTQYPKFNPETIRFRVDDDSPDIITRTIPINFTVTLNRS